MQSLYSKCRVLLFFLMKTVDSVSLSPNVFHKGQIVVMYMDLHETMKTQKGSFIQTIVKYLEKDTKNCQFTMS